MEARAYVTVKVKGVKRSFCGWQPADGSAPLPGSSSAEFLRHWRELKNINSVEVKGAIDETSAKLIERRVRGPVQVDDWLAGRPRFAELIPLEARAAQ